MSEEGNIYNPIRYKGYYYDIEANMYYCKSRYYVPELFRWLNIDSIEYLDIQSINGNNLFMYCNNNPVMYSDGSGHMPKWGQWVLGGLIVVAGIGISIATGGIASVLMAGATSVWASIGIGAAAGAIGGAVSGFAVSVGTQAISGGFENIDYGKAGISAATGAISGAIAGGIFGGIKYAMPARGIGESISGVKTAQANMNSAFNPLSNINKLSGMPFAGRNIGQVVAQVAINYNNAYSAFIMASFDCEIVTLVSGLIYSGMQFGVKTGIGELVKLTGWI